MRSIKLIIYSWNHTMSLRSAIGLTLTCMLICSTGCSTIAKKAIRESVGAESDVQVISEASRASFAKFGDVEVLPIKSDLGALVPGEFRAALPRALETQLTGKEGALGGKGKDRLIIQPIATFFLMKGTLKELVGSHSYAACVFVLRDGSREISRLQIIAKSGATHTNLGDLAQEMGRALNEHIANRSRS